MKTLHLSIFLMTVGILVVLSAQNVKAMPDMSPQDLYKQSDMVFYGQVITKESGPGPDYYQVKVQTFFKNPQTSDSITVAGHKPSEGHMTYPQFEIGDKVLFYIVKQDEILVVSPWSINAGEGCDIHAFLGPAPIPGEPIVRGPPSPLEPVTDENITTRGPFKVNQALLVSYYVWNNFPQPRNVTVQLSAVNQNDITISYYKNQTVAVGACDASTINWIFAPTKVGSYIVNATENGKFTREDFEVVDSKSDVFINSKFVGSPLMQLKSGISAQDVKCKSNLQLVIKTEDNSPACVKIDTAFRLSALGWGYLPSPFVTKTDLLDSKITGGNITEFQYDPQSASIIIKIQTTSDGDLTVTIPKVLTDLSPHYQFKTHTVLTDGMEVNVDSIPTTKGPSFSIPFTNGTQEIEIIGDQIG